MKLTAKLNFTALFVAFTLLASAQDFKGGIIELPHGEKINGYIFFDNSSKKVLFKKNMNSKQEEFTAQMLKSFQINDSIIYISQIVWKDLLPISRDKAQPEGTELNIRDTAFLKELVTGPKVSLYELKDDKFHFYVKKPDEEAAELQYKVFRKKTSDNKVIGEDNVVYRPIFRNQLRALAFDYQDLFYFIDNSSYTAKDLSQIISDINLHSLDTIDKKAMKKIFIGGGITYNSFSFSGTNSQSLQDLQALKNSGYVFKVNADFYGKKKFKKLFLRTEINYSHFNYEGIINNGGSTDGKARYALIINSIGTTASLSYNFLNATDHNFYIGLGTGLNFSSYPKNLITASNANNEEEKMHVKKAWNETLVSRVGFFYKNINAEVTYRLAGNPFSYGFVHSHFNTIGLTLAYGFEF